MQRPVEDDPIKARLADRQAGKNVNVWASVGCAERMEVARALEEA